MTVTNFHVIRKIGSGAFGTVHLVKHIPTGKEFALKAMNKSGCSERAVLREQRVLHEVGTKGTYGVMEYLGSFHDDSH